MDASGVRRCACPFPRIFRVSRKAAKGARQKDPQALQHIAYTLDPSAMAAIRGCVSMKSITSTTKYRIR